MKRLLALPKGALRAARLAACIGLAVAVTPAFGQAEPPAATSEQAPAARADTDEVDDGSIISPNWAAVSVGATVALGTATILSAIDTEERWDIYEETAEGAQAGEDSQSRTNALLGTTLGFVALSTVLTLLAIPWGSDEEGAVETSAIVTPDGVSGGLRLRF